MNMKLNPLVFFGTEDFSADILHDLLDSNYTIEAVVTKPDRKSGRGQKLQASKVKQLANQHKIRVLEISNTTSLYDAIASTNQQTGVLASFGRIIPAEVIKMFANGIINVHPSLLPTYRGPSPIETTILNGDLITGVTIMALNSGIDSGDIYAQEIIKLTGKETKSDLYQTLAQVGSSLLVKTLNQIEFNNLKATPQDHTKASFTKIISKAQSQLNPNKHSATDLERQIRAFQGYPKSRISLNHQDCIIIAANTSDKPKNSLSIMCRDNRYLNVEHLINPNGKRVSITDYINGLN